MPKTKLSTIPLLAAILVAMQAPVPAGAGAAQRSGVLERFELQWRVAWNRHGAGGADNQHLQSKVVFELLAGDAVRVEDQGEQSRGVLTQAWGYREEKQRWRSVWRGKRQVEGDKLLL